MVECGAELDTREAPPSTCVPTLDASIAALGDRYARGTHRHFDGADKWERAAKS